MNPRYSLGRKSVHSRSHPRKEIASMRKILGSFENVIARPLLNPVLLFLLIPVSLPLFVPGTAHAQIWASSGFIVTPGTPVYMTGFSYTPGGLTETATCSTSAVNPATGQPSPAAAGYSDFLASCSVTPSTGAVITSPQCPLGPHTTEGAPSGNPTGGCSIDFQPEPDVTYTINSIHALRFFDAPLGTVCGPTGFNVPGFFEFCFSDPLGYYSMNPNAIPPNSYWPTMPTYTGVSSYVKLLADNTVDVTCAAMGTCAPQNIPYHYCSSGFSLFGTDICTSTIIVAPQQWDVARTSEPWQVQCSDVVQGSVAPVLSGSIWSLSGGMTEISATFTPNFGFTLAQAEKNVDLPTLTGNIRSLLGLS